jgi:hypothetical protein
MLEFALFGRCRNMHFMFYRAVAEADGEKYRGKI